MVTRTFDVKEETTSLLDLIDQVKQGMEIILTEGDEPVARILPVRPPGSPRIAGLHESAFAWISEDFDDPLPDEFWLGDDDDPLYIKEANGDR